MRRTDFTESSNDDPLITSSRIILFAQSLSVIASITGFIGLTIAYKSLTRKSPNSNSNSISISRTTQPPSIG